MRGTAEGKVVQRQAEPFLVGDLATISEFIHARIRECPSSEPSEIYILYQTLITTNKPDIQRFCLRCLQLNAV